VRHSVVYHVTMATHPVIIADAGGAADHLDIIQNSSTDVSSTESIPALPH